MRIIANCICLAMACCSLVSASTISIDPTTTSVSLANPLSININAVGLAHLYAFQFDVTFDPTVLSAVGVSEGSLFSSVGVFFSPGFIDNASGSITFVGDSLSGPGPGLSTNGTLAQITFNAIGIGSSGIHLSNVVLLDSGLGEIAATPVDGAVTVSSPSTVPEPQTGVLLGFALGAMGIVASRKNRGTRS